ncbi:Na+/H+ antiporter [Aquihabitans sp. G128]|uniref:Na+/H+ antiporter n=1 Tax=Aquihabitans sp. G128 TaxID=2849779 RepID=UPI001C24CDCF|nr:Na+/H+ antiporter [Aquihabitans sp. G128]QXC59719.1 Na+/H+ antiporter [Aquihabitans sp. G128]
MDLAFDLIALVVVVTAVGGLARRWSLPGPLLLLVVGIGGSFLPRFEGFTLDPDLVLVGLLPPLLYAAAVRTSLLDLRHNIRPIASLSVGLVVATTLGVGYVVWWLLPVPLAAAFALGAVVAPPDAVAATAIARRVGLPRRIVTILEGEGLVNDATALVCLGAAITAITGHISALEISREFAVSAVGGTAVGVLVAVAVGKVRAHVDDVLTQTSISLVTPFLAYLVAEEVHASGVLAVVITGLILGHKATLLQSASSRLFERSNWSTIEFLLENAVFLLIGLQVRSILSGVGDSELSAGRIALAAVATFGAVVVLRALWVFASVGFLRRGVADDEDAAATFSWQGTTVVAWAGMRGVVTLAAAFVLPEETPHREVLVLMAFVVAAASLLLEGSSLPMLVARLGLAAPDHHEDALQAAAVYQRAATAGLAELDALDLSEVAPEVVGRLRRRSLERADSVWERLGGSDETPSQAYARLRAQMLAVERAEVLRIRSTGTVPHEVLQQVLDALDVEESVLELAHPSSTAEREVDLQAPGTGSGCEHLVAASEQPIPAPLTPTGCEECLRDGTPWVHLRLCLACGHVGCCDSSVGNHATHHFEGSGHPVMRSFELGEAWRWCYEDDLLG